METGIEQLIEISQLFGKNPLYVIAGGGNTSFKTKDKLWIKASGSALASIDESGLVCLSRQGLSQMAEKNYSTIPAQREEEVKNDLNASILYPKDKRPSVETSLHEIIDYAFVVHTHPTLVNALMCAVEAQKKCHEIFGNEVLFVPYTDPGYVLFKKVYDLAEAYKQEHAISPQIIFLENHGVFVAANTTEEVEAIYADIDEKLNAYVSEPLPDFKVREEELNDLSAKLLSKGTLVKLFRSELIANFVCCAEVFKAVDTAFTPDGIVYCKAKYPFVATPEDIPETVRDFEKKHGFPPKVIAVKDQGVVVIEDSEKAVNTVIEVYSDMLKIAFYAKNFGDSKAMTEEQIAFIDNWEVENYRRKIAKS